MKKEELLKSISDMLKKHEDFLNENPEIFHAIEDRFFKAIDDDYSDEDPEFVSWEDPEASALYDDEQDYTGGDYGYDEMFDNPEDEDYVTQDEEQEQDEADRWLAAEEERRAREAQGQSESDTDTSEVRDIQEEAKPSKVESPAAVSQAQPQKRSSANEWKAKDQYSPEHAKAIQEFKSQGYSDREAERLAGAHDSPVSFFEALKRRTSPSEPSAKMLSEMKDVAKKWLSDARKNTEYDPKKNPILSASGKTHRAHEEAYGGFVQAYNDFLNSDELKGLGRKERRQAIKDFTQKWNEENPDFRERGIAAADAGSAFSEAAEARKQELMNGLASILGAGQMHVDDSDQGYSAEVANMGGGAVSDQAAAQMVGAGSDEDKGFQANIKKDPAMMFAEKNPDVVKQLREKLKTKLSPEQSDRMSALGSFRSENKPQQPKSPQAAPPKKVKTLNDKGLQMINDYLIEYAPLINIKSSKLGRGAPEHVDDGDLLMAGMHGLIDAFHTYDPSKGASFKSHAGRRIEGKMRDYISAGGPNSVDKYFYDQARKMMGGNKVSQPAAATTGSTAEPQQAQAPSMPAPQQTTPGPVEAPAPQPAEIKNKKPEGSV